MSLPESPVTVFLKEPFTCLAIQLQRLNITLAGNRIGKAVEVLVTNLPKGGSDGAGGLCAEFISKAFTREMRLGEPTNLFIVEPVLVDPLHRRRCRRREATQESTQVGRWNGPDPEEPKDMIDPVGRVVP